MDVRHLYAEWDAHPVTRKQMELLIHEINSIRELIPTGDLVEADSRLKVISDTLIASLAQWPS